MRQFLLGKNVAYASDADLSAVADGAIGVFVNVDGKLTVATTGKEVTKEAMLVLGRPSDKGGPIVLPIYKNNFSFVKGEYKVATKFSANFAVPAPTKIGDYSIIVVLKGTKFNERNKWTAMIHVKDVTMSAKTLASKLAAAINGNTIGSGVKATVNTATITITAEKSGVDYEILGADELFDVKADITAKGLPAYGDAKYIQDLAEKAAADAGFEYTYRDAYTYLYPNYPLNPLKAYDAKDTGFTIFTLRFAEPRDVKTRDEVVNQIIQVAYPTGASAISRFETVLNGISGIEATNEESSEEEQPDGGDGEL